MNATTTRDRILDALQAILIEDGFSAVTLEGVAAAAGVSKGGLLYHFPNKSALMDGLIRRLSAAADAEFEEARSGPDGIVRTFLRTSLPSSPDEAEVYWAVIAALRSEEGITDEARALVVRIFAEWSRMLHDEIGDPVLAETIRLVGDGLYLSAIAGLPTPQTDVLHGVMDRLIAEADRTGASAGTSAD
ncbi:TetR/AcrR family transcriptional regulator [Nocardiopsis coralliicola]